MAAADAVGHYDPPSPPPPPPPPPAPPAPPAAAADAPRRDGGGSQHLPPGAVLGRAAGVERESPKTREEEALGGRRGPLLGVQVHQHCTPVRRIAAVLADAAARRGAFAGASCVYLYIDTLTPADFSRPVAHDLAAGRLGRREAWLWLGVEVRELRAGDYAELQRLHRRCGGEWNREEMVVRQLRAVGGKREQAGDAVRHAAWSAQCAAAGEATGMAAEFVAAFNPAAELVALPAPRKPNQTRGGVPTNRLDLCSSSRGGALGADFGGCHVTVDELLLCPAGAADDARRAAARAVERTPELVTLLGRTTGDRHTGRPRRHRDVPADVPPRPRYRSWDEVVAVFPPLLPESVARRAEARGLALILLRSADASHGPGAQAALVGTAPASIAEVIGWAYAPPAVLRARRAAAASGAAAGRAAHSDGSADLSQEWRERRGARVDAAA
eukprot:gene11060-4090_t